MKKEKENQRYEEIAQLARKVGKPFKSGQYLAEVSWLLKKMIIDAALGGKLDQHLG